MYSQPDLRLTVPECLRVASDYLIQSVKTWLNIFISLRFFSNKRCALIQWIVVFKMVKIILVAIIVALVYSQPELRLTIADWLKNVSEILVDSVDKKQDDYQKLRFKSNELRDNWTFWLSEESINY